jgi:uncharacterized protein (TIGR02145 family)
MKILKLLALVACAMLLSQCKTPTQAMQQSSTLSEIPLVLDSTQAQFLEFSSQTNGDPWKAIMLTTQWARSLSNVASAEAFDSMYINVVLKSGLTTRFYFTQVNDSGISMFRGGGKHIDAGDPEIDGLHSANTIVNKKVLIYAAAYSQFYTGNEMQTIVDYFNNSGLGLDLTLLKDKACTYHLIDNFKDYGLAILDTHGEPDAFLTGGTVDIPKALKSEDALKAVLETGFGAGTYDKLASRQLLLEKQFDLNPYKPNWYKDSTLRGQYELWASTKYLEGIASMPNTVIMGNMCYSGQTSLVEGGNTPIKTAFANKRLISYYGYAFQDGNSTVVGNAFAKVMEESLVRALVKNFDSTGHANLKPDGSRYSEPKRTGELFFEQFNSNDFSYDGCIDSFTDARDGQTYKAVCIGKQVWMAQNLNYNAPGSITYNDDPTNGTLYGRLYDFNTLMQSAAATSANPSGIQGVCPKGWHVPSQPEFQQMISTVGGVSAAGGAMKSTSTLWTSPNVGATNSSGFSALPGGYMVKDANGNPSYNFINTHAYLWSASLGAPNYYQIYVLTNSDAGIAAPGATEKYSISCRCVKD